MSKRCPKCGAENRDRANFCSICRTSLSATSAFQPSKAPPSAMQPTVIQISSVASSSSIQNQANPGALVSLNAAVPIATVVSRNPGKNTFLPKWLSQHELANGRIMIIDPPRDAALPFDPSRLMVVIAFILIALGLCLVTAIFSIILFVILAVLGLGSLCLLPVVIPVLSGLIPSLIYLLRGKRTTPFVNFQVDDNGKPVNSVIYLKEGAGNLHLGDCIRVYGKYQRRTNTIRAHKVEVYESSGKPTLYVVRGVRPWPIWLGIFILSSVSLLYGWILFSGNFPQFFR